MKLQKGLGIKNYVIKFEKNLSDMRYSVRDGQKLHVNYTLLVYISVIFVSLLCVHS